MSVCSFIFLAFVAHGIEVKVKVLNPETDPVEGALVSVMRTNDSIPLVGSVSDTDGIAVMEYPGDDLRNLKLEVRRVGYEKMETDTVGTFQAVTIFPVSRDLTEFVVSAKKSNIEAKGGRLIYNPDGLYSVAKDGSDLIRQTPLVTVLDGQPSIQGIGRAVFYINGREPRMPQQSVITYLASLPPKAIKSVELVTEQGVAYSSSSSGGIVNVVIDDPYTGFKETGRASVSTRNGRFSPSVEGSVAYTNENFKLSLYPIYSHSDSKDEYRYVYDYKDGRRITTYETTKARRDFVYGELNGAYSFGKNKQHEVGASVELSSNETTSDLYSNSSELNLSGDSRKMSGLTSMKYPFQSPMFRANVYGNFLFGKQNLLYIQASHVNVSRDTKTRFELSDLTSDDDISEDVSNQSVDVKFRHSFPDASRLNVGYSLYMGYYRSNEVTDGIGSIFKIKENTNAAFAKYDRNLTRWWNFSVGVRMEYDVRKIDVATGNVNTDKLRFYPEASTSFNFPKGNQNIQLSYSSNSREPAYIALNPHIYWTSDNSYSTGNPYLDKSRSDRVSLNYGFLNMFNFRVSYYHLQHEASRYTMQDGDYVVSTFANNAQSEIYSANFAFRKRIGSFFYLNADTSIHKTWSSLTAYNNVPVHTSDISWNLTCYCQMNIPKRSDWDFILVYFLGSPEGTYTDIQGNWTNQLTVEIAKRFGNWGKLTVSGSNLLGVRKTTHYYSQEFSYNMKALGNPMRFTCSFECYFGKRRMRTAPRGDASIQSRYAF